MNNKRNEFAVAPGRRKVRRIVALAIAGSVLCCAPLLPWPRPAASPAGAATIPHSGGSLALPAPCLVGAVAQGPATPPAAALTSRLSACSLPLPASRGSGSADQVVVIYGDSLTVESEGAVKRLARGTSAKVVFRAFGGTAMCDWTAQAARDRVALHPQRVILAFTGNTASCVAADYRALGTEGAVANYQRALTRMRSIYPTESMTVVLAPAMNELPTGWFPFNGNPALNAMYRRTASELHITVDPEADNALTPRHVFAWMRPLTPGGRPVLVRLSDGVHLTPDGALLYGRALLNPVSEV